MCLQLCYEALRSHPDEDIGGSPDVQSEDGWRKVDPVCVSVVAALLHRGDGVLTEGHAASTPLCHLLCVHHVTAHRLQPRSVCQQRRHSSVDSL